MIRAIPLLSAAAMLGAALLVVPSAEGQVRHDSTAPIDFDAALIELQDKANRAVLSGGVSIRQATMRLNADRVTVAYTGQVIGGSPQVSRLDAAGGVTVTRPDQTARAQFAVYDLNARRITMVGNVRLTQGTNTLNGGRLTIDLDTGRAVIDGRPSGGSAAPGTTTTPGGRVSGRFSVPERK
jgi:lipopolysaccharide export system protein LptA